MKKKAGFIQLESKFSLLLIPTMKPNIDHIQNQSTKVVYFTDIALYLEYNLVKSKNGVKDNAIKNPKIISHIKVKIF